MPWYVSAYFEVFSDGNVLRSKRDSYQTLFLLITISNSIGVQEAYGESAFDELDEIL